MKYGESVFDVLYLILTVTVGVIILIKARNGNEKLMGAELTAVVEGFDRFGECWFGRTPLDAPDIDGKVFFTSERKLAVGEYVKIRITDTLDYDLIGEVISE